ncbi:MAG TPA: CDP-alcohol phosphatidyltransferase family protein [Candidatus Limnocylindrales bacterium]
MSISNETRGRIKRVFEPIALWMGRLGLTPDGLTLIGFGITALGAASLTLQLWLVGGLLLIVGGVFDMFDGTLARATATVSPFGAFLDSVFDRAGEAIVYLGIVWGAVLAGPSSSEIGLLGSDIVVILAAAAMGAAFMVSYTRARSEGLGFTAGTRMAAVGVLPREVRLLILSLGLVLTGATASFAFLAIALAVIAIGATITVIQRILHVRSQAKSATNPIL